MNKLKLFISALLVVVTAIVAMQGVSAYTYGSNYYYDEGNLGHGHVEIVPAGPVHSTVYPTVPRYQVTGLRPVHYTYVQPPVYTQHSAHTVYPYYGYIASRYGHSQFYGGVYSGYSGTYGNANYGQYSNRFVY